MTMQLGQMMREWRKYNGLKLRQVAEMTEIPVPTLSRMEQGKALRAVTLQKLLIFLFSEESNGQVPKEVRKKESR